MSIIVKQVKNNKNLGSRRVKFLKMNEMEMQMTEPLCSRGTHQLSSFSLTIIIISVIHSPNPDIELMSPGACLDIVKLF